MYIGYKPLKHFGTLEPFGTLTSLLCLAILGPRLAIFGLTPAIEVNITKDHTSNRFQQGLQFVS